MRYSALLALAHVAATAVVAAVNVLPRDETSTADVGAPRLTANTKDLDKDACLVAINAVSSSSSGSIKPSLALDCLQSMPVDVQTNLKLVDQLTYQAETLSTLGYLKTPPAGYLIPGVDIMAAFDQMKQKLRDGNYANQWHFLEEVFNVYNAASEGHFTWRPKLMNVFSFSRAFSLVSVSSDGVQLPKVYVNSDFTDSQEQGYSPSEIVSIDGTPIDDVTTKESFFALTQDPDSHYNLLMEPQGVHKIGGEFWKGWHTSGIPDVHNVTFANSTTASFRNVATYTHSPKEYPIETGADLFSAYGLPRFASDDKGGINLGASDASSFAAMLNVLNRHSLASSSSSSRRRRRDVSLVDARDVVLPSALNPFVSHKLGMMHGYFLDKPDYADVCVLAIPSFSTNGTSSNFRIEVEETRRVVREFITKCKQANRSKVVIDVSGNGGGNYAAGVELFRNFFPKAEYKQAYSFRVSPLMRYLATNMEDDEKYSFYQQRPEEYKPSFDDFFKPSPDIKQDTLTGHVLIEPSSLASIYDAAPIDTSQDPPFKADDIIILSDGHAGSTCAGVVSLFYSEASVRVVAFGGRPLEKPMQAIGGTRGGFSYDEAKFHNLSSIFNAAGARQRPDPPAGVSRPPRWPMALQSLFQWSTNWNNEFAVGAAADAVPLHFSYEAAHCRRFYRPENLHDYTTAWADAAAVAWKGAKCVKGSTVNSDGTIGKGGMDGAPPYSDDVRSRVRYVGLGAVNGGVAASGTLPTQGGRKTGSETSSNDGKKDAAGSLRASSVAAAGVAVVMAGLLVL